MSSDFYRVVRLQARNVKRIKAVDVTPDGQGIVVVAGENGEGKTSLLDALMWALAGKGAIDKEPIRRGQQRAEVTVDCGDFIARRVITPTQQKLELKTANGEKIEQPQTFLDNILGRLTFDPLRFANMSGRNRVETLLELIPGLDKTLREIETERATTYDNRRVVSHSLRNVQGELEEMDTPEKDAPAELVSTKELVAEKNRRQAVIDNNNKRRRQLTEKATTCRGLKDKIGGLKAELAETEKEYAESLKDNEFLTGKVNALTDPNMAEIDAEIEAVTETNARATHAQAYREKQAKVETVQAEHDELTMQLTAIEKQKEDVLEKAKFPVSGLKFGDSEVMFNSILFDQLSSAEQVKVSLAMAMAMNPKLRVIRITDGSLLDTKSLATIEAMAKERDFQVWVEVVGNDRKGATVVIEDGQVKEAVEA